MTIPDHLLCPDWNQKSIVPATIIPTLYDPSIEQNATFPGPRGDKEKLF